MAMLPDKELRIDPLAMTDVYTEKPPHAKAYTAYALALQAAYRVRPQDICDAYSRRALGAEHLASAAAVFRRLLID
jgi:hypothetical protein